MLAAIDAIELARKNGANTIGVIHNSDRPLACDGCVVLCSVAHNPSLLGKTATASTAPPNVSDPIFVVAVINLSRTMKVLQSTRKYRRPL